jgi:hypothetical protein
MVRTVRTVGATLIVIGLVAAVVFAVYVVGDREYGTAALLLERNPGNVMYEARYGGAFIKRALLVSGAVAGVLVALNGTTLLLLGHLAARFNATESTARRAQPLD